MQKTRCFLKENELAAIMFEKQTQIGKHSGSKTV